MRANRSKRRPLLLSPLEFERKALSRAGLDQSAQLDCCGPGAEQVRHWFEDARSESLADRLVILAGLAGGLSDSIATGSALWIEAVRGPDGRVHTPTIPRPGQCSTATITSVATPVTTPQAKRRLAEQTQTGLVDLESVAFAELAKAAGLRWAIVRGVSDDVFMSLPDGIGRWVDDRGRTRAGPVLRQILLRPGSIGMMMRLDRDSRRAMRAVAELLKQMLPAASDA